MAQAFTCSPPPGPWPRPPLSSMPANQYDAYCNGVWTAEDHRAIDSYRRTMSSSFVQRSVTVVLAVVAVWSVTPAKAGEADDQYAVAAGHYAHQRWQLAAEAFQALLAAHPDFAKRDLAAFYCGESLLQLHRHDEAAVWYRDYLRRSPAGPQARQSLFRLGESAYLSGKNEAAGRELRRFVQQYPDDGLDAFVLAYLGEVALAQADLLAAERYFRQCLKRFPEGRMQDDCRLGLARTQEKQGNPDSAERLYLALAAKTSSPVAADAQFDLGALQYARRVPRGSQELRHFRECLAR